MFTKIGSFGRILWVGDSMFLSWLLVVSTLCWFSLAYRVIIPNSAPLLSYRCLLCFLCTWYSPLCCFLLWGHCSYWIKEWPTVLRMIPTLLIISTMALLEIRSHFEVLGVRFSTCLFKQTQFNLKQKRNKKNDECWMMEQNYLSRFLPSWAGLSLLCWFLTPIAYPALGI